jgi:predicted dehydrogenase
MSGAVGVAVVGAGVISEQYLTNLTTFPDVRVLAIADLDTDRARAVADRHGVAVAGTLADVLAIPEVEVVVNLTIPAAHVEVAMAAIEAGKHVYGEKPLALLPADGAKLLAAATARGLLVASAPDTFLGAGVQSAIRAVDAGLIGTPIAAVAATRGPGPERWHPNPAFLYQRGAGPLFDMSPYYLTALVAALGSITRVAAVGRLTHAKRTIGSGPLAGTEFDVEVPTHLVALVDFAAGPSASATFSFDSPVPETLLELTGTEGALRLPDPNTFGGPLRLHDGSKDGWRDLPVEGSTVGRGLGVLELARALRAGVPHRATGALGQHVLETMTAIADSANDGEFRTVASTVDRPPALPADWDPHAATL